MILIPLTILILITFYLDITFDKRASKIIQELKEDGEQIRKIEQEMNKLSSISATMYGQIIEEVKENVDTDTEQTTDNKQ